MTERLFSLAHYFCLDHFEHKDLFNDTMKIWEPLHLLTQYIASYQLGTINVDIKEGVFLENPHLITIGEGTVIEEGAYIKGPAIIGKHCEIRNGAYIRENVVIGDRCVIGHTTEIKHSVLFNRVKAAHFAFIGDSIVGSEVNLGAGVICANLRLDRSPVVVRAHDQTSATHLKKFGAILGDNCQIGCKVVCNPGTIVGKGAICYPNTTLSGFLPEKMVARSSCRTEIVSQ
jgi:UDP-N-acetylglucosamine diphosphorylase / glucose-1-phosphate thymidylyltransferase / UDP-N-acetylgalactosamine diphosphorylase / glucosamine-1-phosphate N-acetyltransferase / galactosamine-1-phosphate N-acetyltransferase